MPTQQGPKITGENLPIVIFQVPTTELAAFGPPFLFLQCKLEMLPFIRGAIAYWTLENRWMGNDAEVYEAVSRMVEQELAPALTVQEVAANYGATFQVLDGETLEVAQGEELVPPPWEFRLVTHPGGAILEFRSMATEE